MIKALDHLVLTVSDIPTSLAFYQNAIGLEARAFTSATGGQRWALHWPQGKINLHQAGQEFEPKAKQATPGSADLCFLTDHPIEQVIDQLRQAQVSLVAGPVERTGASGPICSVYVRDPDGNLIEIANELAELR